MEALTEIGHILVTDTAKLLGDAEEYATNEFLFIPSFENISKIGNPKNIVRAFHDLHGPKAVRPAMHVMRCCSASDADEMIGWLDEDLNRADGKIPDAELIILAKALMTDGIMGRAKPSKKDGSGKYSDSFDASEFVDAAMVHLGLSSTDAWQLTMTQFQRQIEMKFPDKDGGTMSESQCKDAKAMLLAKRERAGL